MNADDAHARARLTAGPDVLRDLARGAEAAADSFEQLARDLAALADELPCGPDDPMGLRVGARRLIAQRQALHHREIAAAYRRAAAGERPW